MADRVFVVHARWDAAARRWWAESDDVPGLVTEAASFEELVERVLAIAPELMALNGLGGRGADLPIQVVAERTEFVHLAS